MSLTLTSCCRSTKAIGAALPSAAVSAATFAASRSHPPSANSGPASLSYILNGALPSVVYVAPFKVKNGDRLAFEVGASVRITACSAALSLNSRIIRSFVRSDLLRTLTLLFAGIQVTFQAEEDESFSFVSAI